MAKAGVPGIEKDQILDVVPAKAGTHDHDAFEFARAVFMGPGYPLRGFRDDEV